MTKPLSGSHGTVWQVNLKLLHVFVTGTLAMVMFPTNPRWWGFAIPAVALGLAALISGAQAIGLIVKLRQRKKAQEMISRRGKAPKSAKLAGHDDLSKAGML